MRALVVTAESALQGLVASGLEARGHESDLFTTAEDALLRCANSTYHLAVIDRALPGMDGLELCCRIRSRAWGSQLVVLILAADGSPVEVESILDVGADDFLVRPITAEKLKLRLAVAEGRLQIRSALLQTAEELRRERNFVSAVLESSGALFMVLDRKGRIVRFNRSCEQLTGFSSAEVRFRRPEDLLVDSDDAERVGQTYCRLLRGDTPGEFETWLLAKDGRRHLVRWANTTLVDADDQVDFVISTGIDFTRHKELEWRIVQAKREWEQTFDTVPELIFLVDADHRITRANRAMASFLGKEPRQLLGKRWFDKLHGTAVPPAGCIASALSERREHFGEAFFERIGRNFLLSATPFADPSSGAWRAVIVGRDLTDRERAEEVARRQAMIAQIEEIFSAFRHEVGNAMNTLRTTLDVLRANYTVFGEEKRLEYLARCDDTVQVAERLLKMIRHYQQYDRLQLEAVSLSAFLSERRSVIQDLAAAEEMQCHIRLAESDVMVEANEAALFQVLVNLLNNAMTACRDRAEPQVVITCGTTGGWQTITVADNGIGIATHDLPRVFTPFFSMSEGGSGLGLAIAQKLMNQMGGEIAINSELDKGTTAELRLPALQQ